VSAFPLGATAPAFAPVLGVPFGVALGVAFGVVLGCCAGAFWSGVAVLGALVPGAVCAGWFVLGFVPGVDV
jgi:hypothetical protein